MTSFAVNRPFECAPHATRSIAMALTLSLNLAIVLFALLPGAPHMLNAPPPESLLAAIVQPPPPPVPPPAVPILRAAPHVAAPTVPVLVTHPVPLAMPVLPNIAPITSIVQTVPTTSAAVAPSTGSAGNSDATIAYETATTPDYPIEALRAGIQGTVLLKVLVSTNGQPTEVVVERSSGSRLLDDAARRHVLAAWRFHPAMRNGHAVEAWALVPVRFKLDRE
ncbi:MAG TPA: TonB family protein [Rhodanobacteraceae bacterium]|nr:TonB family protein [Rhodanobacteraceae bacterium]